ncbi:MAG: hypothetical protein LEGION0398_MBIBDBAK_01310 [Legionellaceae bacterium]
MNPPSITAIIQQPTQRVIKKSSKALRKNIGQISGILFTLAGSLAVTGHFVLGMTEALDYDNPDNSQQSINVKKGVIITSAILSYISSLCLHVENNIEFCVKLTNMGKEKNKKIERGYYYITLPFSIPFSLLTALASTGLSYAGVKKTIELCLSNTSSLSLGERQGIIISSLAIAAIDFPQTLANEGKDTYEGMAILVQQGIPIFLNQLKKSPVYIQKSFQLLAERTKELAYALVKGPDNLCNEILGLFTKPARSLYKNKIQILSFTSVYVIPLLLTLGGSIAYGAQFYYGIDCLEEFIRDINKNSPNEGLLHFAIRYFGNCQEVINTVSYLKYPVAITSFINCLLFYGQYTVENTIDFEKYVFEKLSKTYYEIRHAHAAIYGYYQQCIGHFSFNSYDTDEYAGIFSQKLSCPSWQTMLETTCDWGSWLVILLIRWIYVGSSAALTIAGMDKLTNINFLNGLIGFSDVCQAYIVEGMETKEKMEALYHSAKEKVLHCLPVKSEHRSEEDEENPDLMENTALPTIKSYHSLQDIEMIEVNSTSTENTTLSPLNFFNSEQKKINTILSDFGKYPFFHKNNISETTPLNSINTINYNR